jgi:hypothetical protein
VKPRRDTQTEKRALAQVARHLDTLGLDEGWLVMFDMRAKRSWNPRVSMKTVKASRSRRPSTGHDASRTERGQAASTNFPGPAIGVRRREEGRNRGW